MENIKENQKNMINLDQVYFKQKTKNRRDLYCSTFKTRS